MKQLIKNMSKRTKNIVFGGAYALLVLAAVCPPLYFSASGNGALILGAPVAMWYWVETVRGEIDCEPAPVTAGGE